MYNNNGSSWRKWDLHVHTPVSLCSDYGGDTEEIWKKFFDQLEKLSKNIKVIGINDYLFLDGYKKVLEYKRSGGLKGIELLLPVIEFRLKEFVGHKDLKRLNYHIIFADDSLLAVEQIETHFLSGLRGKANFDPEISKGYTWGGVVTRETLIDLGKHIYDKTPPDKLTSLNKNYLEIGFNNINFEIAKIEDLLGENAEGNSYLRNKYYKAIGKAEWGDFRWDGSVLEKATIINNTHFVFSASPTVQNANKGKDSLKKDQVNSRLLHCSDAHMFAKDEGKTNPKELGHCFTWVKANPTFEGLRELLYEYDLRVRIQENLPDQKIPYEVIKEVRFIPSNTLGKERFTPDPIPLNQDLNVVIGGKSSGKSLLLYHIASTIDPDQVKNKEEGPEEKKKDKYGFKRDEIDFEVTWANDEKQLLSQSFESNTTNYSILYIPQSYIQKLADTEGRKTRKEVGKIIRDTLLQKETYKKNYNDFIIEVKRLDSIRENLIADYITALDVYKASIAHVQGIGDKKAINLYIEQLKKKIEDLKKSADVTPENEETYVLNTEKKQSLNTHLFELKNDYEKIESYKYSLDKLVEQIFQGKEQLIKELKNSVVRSNVEELLKLINDIKNIPPDIDAKILNKENGIIAKAESVITNEIETIDKILKPIADRFVNKEEIEKVESQILSELAKIDRINSYSDEILVKEQQKNNAKTKLLDEYKRTYKQYVEIVDKLNERSTEIGDLVLKGSIKFYTKRFNERIRALINNKSSGSLVETNLPFDDEKDIHDVEDIDLLTSKLSQLFDFVVNDNIVLKANATKKDILNAFFKDEFFDYWEILVGGDEIANMSPGKAGLVLLKLLIDLSDSKCPILIDQPEDNLDNRSIYSDLVQYIRTKKSHRQFIVVTHNPNIVVGADSENVVVANQNDQDPNRLNKNYQFDYISGALEFSSKKIIDPDNILTSMGIREHVTEILEGGNEAFQKREAKYRIDKTH